MPNYDRKSALGILALSLAGLAIFLFGVLAHAQTRANQGPLGATRPGRVTLKGTVRKVLHHPCSDRLSALRKESIHSPYCATTDVVLATKDGLINVRLGPVKFIRDNHFLFVDGDRLQVIGFSVQGHGHRMIVSEEVIKSKRDLTLRDLHGQPLWSHSAITDRVPGPAIAQKRFQSVGEDATARRSVPTGKAVVKDSIPEIRNGDVK
jgi:hypothetical protein